MRLSVFECTKCSRKSVAEPMARMGAHGYAPAEHCAVPATELYLESDACLHVWYVVTVEPTADDGGVRDQHQCLEGKGHPGRHLCPCGGEV